MAGQFLPPATRSLRNYLDVEAKPPERTVQLVMQEPPAPDYPAAARKIRNRSRAEYALPKTRVEETLTKLTANAG